MEIFNIKTEIFFCLTKSLFSKFKRRTITMYSKYFLTEDKQIAYCHQHMQKIMIFWAFDSPIWLLAKCFWSCCWSAWWCVTCGVCGACCCCWGIFAWLNWCADCECGTKFPFWLLFWWLWLLFMLFTIIGEIICADCDEGTLIAELLDIMLVGLIRTVEFDGLVYGISSSFFYILLI